MILLTIVVFGIILGLLVFVHELGHFLMAKRAGMRVDEFGFGFPPRLIGFKRGETIYSINWIPLGGFVKIAGEDGSHEDDPRSFGAKGFWARFGTLIAGVTMNVILAWVLVSIGFGVGLPAVVEEGQEIPPHATLRNVSVGILEVQVGSPAEAAGLKAGDTIFEINHQSVSTIDQVLDLTRQNVGKETEFGIKRGSDSMEKMITPRVNPPEGQGPIGIAPGLIGYLSYPWYEAPVKGAQQTWNFLYLTVTTFAGIIGRMLTGHNAGVALSGPVGIAVLTRDYTQLGIIYLLQFTAILSINLAVINVLPFPALDGGRLLFLVIEKIRGKKMNPRAEMWANTIGFSLLLLLMAVITFKDITRYSEGFKHLFQNLF